MIHAAAHSARKDPTAMTSPDSTAAAEPGDLAELVATASRVLADAEQGDLIWGHCSVRDPHGRGVWIKSAEWGMEEVTADRVHLVDSSGEVKHGSGIRHSEYPIHTEILAARPDAGAVVHTHAPYCVALAAAGHRLRAVSHAATIVTPPEVPRFTDTADLILTPELGRALAHTLGSANAAFLVNHGIVTVGPSLQHATVVAIVLERAAQQQLLTIGAGGTPSWSDEAESLAKREHIYHPAALDAVWSYLVRRLPAAPR